MFYFYFDKLQHLLYCCQPVTVIRLPARIINFLRARFKQIWQIWLATGPSIVRTNNTGDFPLSCLLITVPGCKNFSVTVMLFYIPWFSCWVYFAALVIQEYFTIFCVKSWLCSSSDPIILQHLINIYSIEVFLKIIKIMMKWSTQSQYYFSYLSLKHHNVTLP